jgi:hypothetical protein
VEFLVDALGERAADAVDLREVVDARRKQSAQAAEAGQKPLPAFRADA